MLKYTVKRLLQSLITILIAVTVVFLLMRMLPTDYYFTEDQLMKFTPEQKEAALEAAGLLDPIGEQLVRFYGQLLHLDFGTSRRIQNGMAVTRVIGDRMGVSLRLGAIAFCISWICGIIIGVVQAAFKGKLPDWLGTAYTVVVNAVPALVMYSLVLVIGSTVFGFPTLYSTRNVGPSSVLPVICLSLSSTAGYALWMRRYMVDELTRDYIKLAKVKGLSYSQIMFRHVLRKRAGAHGPVHPPVPAADHQRLAADGVVLLGARHGPPADRRRPPLRHQRGADPGHVLRCAEHRGHLPGRPSDDGGRPAHHHCRERG